MVEAEQGTKIDRLVSIDIAERFEALQDEVDLLKVEVKQTLVDLREFIMKGKSVFPVKPPAVPHSGTPSNGVASAPALEQVMETETLEPTPLITPFPVKLRADEPQSDASVDAAPALGLGNNALDPVMMGRIITWLGTVKGRGLTLQQLTPYLEAYESAGNLSPLMAKVIIRSVADLDQVTKVSGEATFSPQNYAECISELHEIVCGDADAEHEQEALSNNLLWLERC